MAKDYIRVYQSLIGQARTEQLLRPADRDAIRVDRGGLPADAAVYAPE
jgi:hypothetical protein